MGLKVCQLCAVDFTLKKFLLPLIDGMRDHGWETVAVCSDGSFVADMRQQGYCVKTLTISRSLNPWRALRSLMALVRLFRHEKFDILHVHTPVAAMIGRAAARLVGIPLVVYTAHGFYFHDDMPPWKRRVFIALERMAGCWTDLLLTQSEEDKTTAVSERIMPAEHVLAIGNGVDIDRFDPARVGNGLETRRILEIPQNARVIGFIGRLVKEKGIVEFLSAARILAERAPNVWFLVVGERLASDHAADVTADIAAASAVLGPRLVLAGLRSDIPELLAAMDVFCLPSWREGMPRTIIEAMMMAKPVVATDIRGAREEVVSGDTGILVPVRSPEQLASALGSLVEDVSLAHTMGESGRARALRLYDEKNIVSMQIARIGEYARSRGLAA